MQYLEQGLHVIWEYKYLGGIKFEKSEERTILLLVDCACTCSALASLLQVCDIPIQHLIGLNSECQSYSNVFLVCLRSIYFAEAGAIASLVQFWHSLSVTQCYMYL